MAEYGKLKFKKDKKGKKIETFTRPEDWEKKLKRSHFDSKKDFTGKESKSTEKKEKKSSLFRRLFGNS